MARPRDYPYGATIRSKHLTFSAGAPCLDFANTRELRKGPEPQEFLHRYDDLLVFARRVNLLPARRIRELGSSASADPRKSTAAFRKAIRLREAVFELVTALAAARTPPPAALASINACCRSAAAHAELAYRSGRFERRWLAGPTDLDVVIWPIAESIAALLQSSELCRRLRACDGHDCGWLFLDLSKSQRRRWCNMRACGNRAKAARHYGKRRSG